MANKQKSHKGVLKRVKVTARGKVKFARSGKSHLNSHMRGKKIRQLRNDTFATPGDIKRLERVLHRPLKPSE